MMVSIDIIHTAGDKEIDRERKYARHELIIFGISDCIIMLRGEREESVGLIITLSPACVSAPATRLAVSESVVVRPS